MKNHPKFQTSLQVRLLQITAIALVCLIIATIKLAQNSSLLSDVEEQVQTIEIEETIESNDFEAECYRIANSTPIEFLVDILDGDVQPIDGNAIFFIETSCANDGLIHLSPRQSCAISSAAHQNPNKQIFVLFVTPVGFAESEIPPLIRILKSYTNIHLRNMDISRFIDDPLVANWIFNNREIFRANWAHVQIADFLRLYALYKYGGIYLDLDFVMMRPFDEGVPNFLAAEDVDSIGNSVLGFGHDSVGHFTAKAFIREFMENFNGQIWAFNGPKLFTRMAQALCKTEETSLMTSERCQLFKVHHKNDYFPVHWTNWLHYYVTNNSVNTMETIKNSIGTHMWNSRWRGWDRNSADLDPQSPYMMLAKNFCPKVYNHSSLSF